ncbi:hypothetical protein D3C84_1151190 [compost metagenome]
MVAVVGIDAQLVHHLEAVFAPVFDVDQCVVQRGAVFAGECITLAQGARRRKHIRGDDLVEQACEFAISETNAVECLEFIAKVALQ